MQAGDGGWLDAVLYHPFILRHAYFTSGGEMQVGIPLLFPPLLLFSSGTHSEVTSLGDQGFVDNVGTCPGISRGIP